MAYSYLDLTSRDTYCTGCGQRKFIYADLEHIDAAVAEFYRAHVLCSAREVDIVTGQIVA